jgi:hypothetical protein
MKKFIEFTSIGGTAVAVERAKIDFVEQTSPEGCLIITGPNRGVNVRGQLAEVLSIIEGFDDATERTKDPVRA